MWIFFSFRLLMTMPDQNSSPYDTAAHPNFAVAVDVALFAVRERAVHSALVPRGERFEGRLVLPGGFVRECEDLDQTVRRQLVKGTGLPPDDTTYLEQLGVYGSPGRDSQRSVIAVAYLAICPEKAVPRARGWGDVQWVTPAQAKNLGLLSFDHSRIVRDALARVRSNLEYTTLATMFLPPAFTIGDLREVYEAVWETSLDRANFRRNFRRNETCFVESEALPSERDGPPSERVRRPGRPSQQWWSLRSPRPDGQPSLLDHPLLGPREAWRHRRRHAVHDGESARTSG